MKRKVNIGRKFTKALKAFRLPNNFWNKLVALVFVVGACILVLLSLQEMGNIVSGLRPESTFQENVLIFEPPTVSDVTSPILVSRENCSDCVFANFEAQYFYPHERQLTGVIHIEIPDGIKAKLWSNYEYITTLENEFSDNLILKDDYKDSEITLVIFSSYLSNSSSETKIPLRNFFEKPYKVSVPISIRFSGESGSYPGDWYHADDYFSLRLPNGVSIFDQETGLWSIFPISLYISANFQIGDFIIKAKPDLADPHFFPISLEMLIVRDTTTKRYIYAMALLPLLLSLVFAHAHFFTYKSEKVATGNLILEVLAVMLAVLPLRSVLVPADIDGLVRIDLILGLGIASMVLIAMIIYAKEVWNLKPPDIEVRANK